MMIAAHFLQRPFGWQVGVVLMLWPAMWAGALFLVALIADIRRQLLDS